MDRRLGQGEWRWLVEDGLRIETRGKSMDWGVLVGDDLD